MKDKDRGKAKAIDVSSNSNSWFSDYYSSSDRPCKKHPSSSSVGICAFCLKDRLIKLVCSDCGEQRLSSCSCSSDISSSNRNSCTVEVGSVGRISFLIENEKLSEFPNQSLAKHSNGEEKSSEAVSLLKRSNSACVDIKRSGFWRFRGIFGKKREIGFRDGLNESEDGGVVFESEKKGNFNEIESRRGVLNGEKQGGFLEFEGSFNAVEDSDFIDLKLSFSPESKSEFPPGLKKAGGLSKSGSGFSSGLRGSDLLEHECDSFGHLRGGAAGIFSNRSSSCRITVCDEGIRKSRKSLKVWRWISKQYPSGKSARKS